MGNLADCTWVFEALSRQAGEESAYKTVLKTDSSPACLDSASKTHVQSARLPILRGTYFSMATTNTSTSNAIYWLALSLTPGLGPTRGRKLAERFASVQDIFHASLTELEAQNLQAQSAQHIALGK